MSKYDQLFVTHCLSTDSVLGEAGYSIRATSLESDSPLLSIAMNFNAYELPLIAYDGAQPIPQEAPIRLAAVPLKDLELVAIVHSVYLETDTRGRPNSYFTHVIFVPEEEFSWVSAIKSWGAVKWELPEVDECIDNAFNPPCWISRWPNQGPVKLPKLASLPKTELEDKHYMEELYKYYQESPKAIEFVLCKVLDCLKKRSEMRDGDTPIRGYLLPRKRIGVNQCEGYYSEIKQGEEDGCWPESTNVKFGRNIRETMMQLAFIAWFFPERLLVSQGFSTYEPHKYGVSIANDKLLVGVVHAEGEMADEMMTSQGVEYYENEKVGGVAIDQKNELSVWGKKQIGEIFKSKVFKKFSVEMNRVFVSFKSRKADWDCYLESAKAYDAIKEYELKPSHETAIRLLRYADSNSYVLEKFKEKCDQIVSGYIEASVRFFIVKKHDIFNSYLAYLNRDEIFSWDMVLNQLVSDSFWKISSKGEDLSQRFSFIEKQLGCLRNEAYKKELKGSIKKFFDDESRVKLWKSDEKKIAAIFNFYCKIGEEGAAKSVLSSTAYEHAISGVLKQWRKNSKNDLGYWQKVMPWLMELSIKNNKGNKLFEGLFEDVGFVGLLIDISNTNSYKDWKKFLYLHEANSLEMLGETSIDGEGLPLTSQLMKFLLNDGKKLSDEKVNDLLFFGEDLRVFKIIGDGSQLPDWLFIRIEKFLKRIDLGKLFSKNQSWNTKKDGQDYRLFPFEKLLGELKKFEGYLDSNIPVVDLINSLESLVAIIRFSENVPELFEIDEFEKHLETLERWGEKENKGLRNVVIDFLATKIKVFENQEGGYSRTHGKFILLLISLNHRDPTECFEYLINKGVFLFDVHFGFIPKIFLENGEESKVNLVYSMLKNKWIQKFSAFKLLDSEFLKVKRKVGNRFRFEYMPIANIYSFLGSFFRGKPDDRYDIGRNVGRVVFFILFFIPPLWHLIFTGVNPIGDGYLTGFELLHSFSFGLIALLWGAHDFFSKANNLGKPEHYSTLMYFNWKMIGVALCSFLGVGLSVFFYVSPKLGCPYYAILLLEGIWFLFYLGVIYREDPVDVFLKPGTDVSF